MSESRADLRDAIAAAIANVVTGSGLAQPSAWYPEADAVLSVVSPYLDQRDALAESTVEIGGQVMTQAQFDAARHPLLNGVCSHKERARMEAVYADWAGSEDSATWTGDASPTEPRQSCPDPTHPYLTCPVCGTLAAPTTEPTEPRPAYDSDARCGPDGHVNPHRGCILR